MARGQFRHPPQSPQTQPVYRVLPPNPVSGTGAGAQSPASGKYANEILDDGPIAWWRLGEPSGTTAAEEITGQPTDYINTPTLGVTGLITSDATTAVTFARASLEYTVTGATMPAGSSVGVSIEAWCQFATVTAATRYPIGRWFHTTPTAEAQVYYNVAIGAWRYLYQDATGFRNVHSDAWTPTVGTTYHIVVAHDSVAELVNFYVNGSLLSTEDVSVNGVPVVHAVNGLFSGARAASDYFDGTVEDIAIYNYVLSGTRVLAHYSAATPTSAALETFTGTGAGTQTAQTATGDGTSVGGTISGTGAGTQAAQTATGDGISLLAVTGTGAGTQTTQSGSGTASETFTGTGAGTQAAQTASGSGSTLLAVTGTGAGVQAAQSGEGSGTQLQAVTGTGAGTQQPATGYGVGIGGVSTEQPPSHGHGPPLHAARVTGPAGDRTVYLRPVTGTGAGEQAAASAYGTGFVNDDELVLLLLEAA